MSNHIWRLANRRPVLIATLALLAWAPVIWGFTMAGGILEGMGL